MNTHTAADSVAAQGSIAELEQLLQSFDTAMLTTLTPMGLLRARPMEIQKPVPELDCDLWFVTSLDSAKSDEIAHEHQVGVSCFRRSDRAYLSISAIARIRREPELIAKLFKPSWKLWFPDGPADPRIALIEMKVERGEYWNPEGGPVRLLYEMVKSLVSAEPVPPSLASPKKV
jgi:general stress protein 26